MERDELLSEALGIGIDSLPRQISFLILHLKLETQKPHSTNIPEIYKPAKTAHSQPALLKKQPKAKEGCKWKEMSC